MLDDGNALGYWWRVWSISKISSTPGQHSSILSSSMSMSSHITERLCAVADYCKKTEVKSSTYKKGTRTNLVNVPRYLAWPTMRNKKRPRITAGVRFTFRIVVLLTAKFSEHLFVINSKRLIYNMLTSDYDVSIVVVCCKVKTFAVNRQIFSVQKLKFFSHFFSYTLCLLQKMTNFTPGLIQKSGIYTPGLIQKSDFYTPSL